jgi:NAD(P)-dependent dehydrogenase (short-subunit alcohol dehydrogenase family)
VWSPNRGLAGRAYTASKAGLAGLTRDLAQQRTSRRGIRVSALAPGFVATEMTEHYPPGYLDGPLPRVLAGHPSTPEELAATLVWLAGDAAAYVIGPVGVDGGFTIT